MCVLASVCARRGEGGEGKERKRERREREGEEREREREREGGRCESTAVCMSVYHNGCSFDKIRSRTHSVTCIHTHDDIITSLSHDACHFTLSTYTLLKFVLGL